MSDEKYLVWAEFLPMTGNPRQSIDFNWDYISIKDWDVRCKIKISEGGLKKQ